MIRYTSYALAALLSTVLVVSGCETQPPQPSSETLRATSLFASDARIVGHIDLERVESDAEFPFFGDKEKTQLATFMEDIGFGPDSDLPAIYVALRGPFSDTPWSSASLVIVGEIDRDRMESHLEEHMGEEFTSSSYNGHVVYRIARPGGQALFATLLDEHMALVAPSQEELTVMIDRAAGTGDGFGEDAVTAELMAEVDHRGSAWVIAREATTLPFADVQQADETVQHIATIVRDVALSLDVRQEQVAAQLVLTTNADPNDLASVIRGALSIAKGSPAWTQEQRDLMERINVTERRGHVLITVETDQRSLDMIARNTGR